MSHNNKMEQVVMDGKYRDLIKLINLQRDKLNNQQVEMTKVCRLHIAKHHIFLTSVLASLIMAPHKLFVSHSDQMIIFLLKASKKYVS